MSALGACVGWTVHGLCLSLWLSTTVPMSALGACVGLTVHGLCLSLWLSTTVPMGGFGRIGQEGSGGPCLEQQPYPRMEALVEPVTESA